MSIFFRYYLSAITNPHKVFESLIVERRKLALGIKAVLIPATLYTIVYVFLTFGKGQPFKPWLNIPIENYYRYNILFCAPTMFFGWILSAGFIHVISRAVTSTGSFEQTLCCFGFGIGIASWGTAIHDIVTSFLGAVHIIDQRNYEAVLNSPTVWRILLWLQMTIYLIWFVVLFSKAIKTVYRTNSIQAVILGTIGFLVYQFFFLIFNR